MNRMNNLFDKLPKKYKVNVVFINKEKCTYYLSSSDREGQTVSLKDYEIYRNMHINDREYIFIPIYFSENTRKLEDFE